MNPAVAFCVGMIRLYRYTLSAFVGRTCRYLPSCSDYAETAIRAHGAWRGGWMALARLQRCRPGGGHGIDRVPEMLDPAPPWYAPWRCGQWRQQAGGPRQSARRPHS